MVSHDIKDIVGLGEIIGHVKELILKLIELWVARDERKLKLRRLQLANAREFLELAGQHNLTPERLNNYIALVNDHSVKPIDGH